MLDFDSAKTEWRAEISMPAPIGSLRASISPNGERAVLGMKGEWQLWDLRVGIRLADFRKSRAGAEVDRAEFVDDSVMALYVKDPQQSSIGTYRNGDFERFLCVTLGEGFREQISVYRASTALSPVQEVEHLECSFEEFSVDMVLDEAGRKCPRFALLSSDGADGSAMGASIMDVDHGCEGALLVAHASGYPALACARLAPEARARPQPLGARAAIDWRAQGDRIRAAAAGQGFIWVWDVEVAAMRSNPVGPLPVLYPARRIAEVKHELFDLCTIDARTRCAPELRALLLQKGARVAEQAELEGGADAAGGPVALALQPWAAIASEATLSEPAGSSS
eukprot:tig00020930_g16049.t1